MRQNNSQAKLSKSLRQKLLLYFLSISAIILSVLWITQTIFLDDIYRIIKTARIESTAEFAIENIGDENIGVALDEIHEQNDVNIEIYDTSEGVAFALVYTSREKNDLGMEYMPHELFSYYKDTKESGGEMIFREKETDRKLHGSKNPSADFADEKEDLTYLTCTKITSLGDRELMVVVRSAITPITSTVETMRFLLIIMTGLVVLLSVAMSIMASWRFSKPLKDTTAKAKQLAHEDYSVSFDSCGYREVEELNSALNFASNELGLASGLRKELVANVSHDLRTPLTMIKGYAEVMRDIPGEMNEENLQAIIDESTRLSQLVSDLLDISKLQSGAVPLEKTDFSITACTSDILGRFATIKEQQGYSISFSYDKEVFVNADKARIEQVLYNFISNAVNYSGDRKTVQVTQKLQGAVVRIEVTDSGQGIEPEKMKNIWDRYYRVDKNHQRSVVGTGLGLSIVKEILDLHNTHFGVTSTPGEGSTFWFELDVVNTEIN